MPLTELRWGILFKTVKLKVVQWDTNSPYRIIQLSGCVAADDVAHPNYNVPPGITFTIRCNVPDPSLEKNVAWYFEDQLLEPRDCGDRLRQVSTSRL